MTSSSSLGRGLCAALVALLLFPFTVAAQDLEKLVVAAYSLRRRGKFRAAAAAFEQILPQVKNKTDKRLLALEVAEMFRVMGRPEKAILLYRRNNDIPREIDTLLSLGTEKGKQDALTISRYVKYPRGEAMALAKLGQTDAALALMQKHGLGWDRAELLGELGRHDEAAKAYEGLQRFYEMAGALEKAGRVREARRAYEDAIEQLRFKLRDPSGSLQIVRRLKQAYDGAQSGVARERRRLDLARAYGRLAEDYRKLAAAYAGSGRPENLPKAPKLAQNAINFIQKQRELLEDTAGGGDAYGAAAAEKEDLAGKVASVREELARYQQGAR